MEFKRNYFHDQRLLYWGLPRTGSRFVFSALKAHFKCDLPVPSHDVGIDEEFSDYRVICSVRNPYRRVLSCWKWMNLIGDDRFFPQDFDKFVRYVVPGECLPVFVMLGEHVHRIDHLVRLENVAEDLSVIPEFPVDYVLPENGFASDYDKPFEEYFSSPETEERVWTVYEPDFTSFGYQRYCYS